MSWQTIGQLQEWNKTNNYEARTLRKLLTSTFRGNKYTQWGNDREDDCERQFIFTHIDDELASFEMQQQLGATTEDI